MKALSRYLGPLKAGRGVLLWGEPLRPLAAAAAAWGVARGAPVLVVDAANRFDPYGLVRQARGRGLAREAVLSRVRVARAFTSHQLVRLLQEGLPSPLEPGTLMIILGPVSLFYDEQVPLTERRRLFQDLTNLLGRIKSQAALLLLQPLMPKEAANQHFGRLLVPVMDYFVEVFGGRARDLFRKWSLPSPQAPHPTRVSWPGKAGFFVRGPDFPGQIKPHKGLGEGF